MKPHNPQDPELARVPDDVGPVLVEALRGERDASGKDEWRQWMREFGQRLRRTRDFLGLSQEEVARLAGVSQGAVSRLETAHGLATPLLIVLKVQQAIARHLRKLDPAVLNPELRRNLELVEQLGAPFGGDLPITEEASLEALVRLYRDTPERHRQTVLDIVQAVVEGLKASGA